MKRKGWGRGGEGKRRGDEGEVRGKGGEGSYEVQCAEGEVRAGLCRNNLCVHYVCNVM